MLIVISDNDFKPNETAVVNDLFRSGLDLFHIRKCEADGKELLKFIDQIDHVYRDKLVLSHHHELGVNLGLRRFHYAGRDRKIWENMNWEGLNEKWIYSTSVHSISEHNKLPDHFSYAFLSPVFDSISKPGYKGELFDFSKRRNHAIKLIGLGGIKAGNASTAIHYGFDGVALLGTIWNAADPVNEFRKVKQEIDKELSLLPPSEGDKEGGFSENQISPEKP